MPTRLEHEQGLESEISATILHVSILRSNLEQIKQEIATNVKGIHAAYEGEVELAREGALDRLARRREVQKEVGSLLQPYEALEYEIDKLLAHLNRARANVEAILGRRAGQGWG
jgi:hypothetical protein